MHLNSRTIFIYLLRLPSLILSSTFCIFSVFTRQQATPGDKRQLREHGMKFLPLVSVGTLYLAYESANFKPISLRTTGAIWPQIQEQDPGFGVWSPQRVTYCHEQHLGVSGAANKPPVKLCRWVRLSSCYWRQARLYPHFRRLGRGLQKNDVRRRGRAPG